MNAHVVVLCLSGFALIGALPVLFFRRGRLNRGWWLTAAPFVVDAALMLAALGGFVESAALPARYASTLAYAAVPLAAAAIALIGCTVGVHRVPLSLWHQDDDTPDALVTFGPYAVIRHPFYAAFILLLLAAAAALPHAGTLLMFGAGTVQLRCTALREERRLLASKHAASYVVVMTRTGRFVPRITLAPALGLTRALRSSAPEPRSSID